MTIAREDALKLRLDGQTYRQIGTALGVSRQRIQQILSPPTAVRNMVVERAGGLCQDCGVGVGYSGHVHHKYGAEENYNDLFNLQLLCLSCHRKAHPSLRTNTLESRRKLRRATMPEVPLGKHLTCKALLKKGVRRGEICGHTWLPRSVWVHKCPGCNSFMWHVEPEKVKS